MEPTGFICSSGLSIDFVISLGWAFTTNLTTAIKNMKTKTSRVMIVVACGLMACLLLASSGQTANRGSNSLVDMEIRQQPLELRMLVRVLRNCEENDRPVHPGIVQWASASLPTGDNQLAQTNNTSTRVLFQLD